MLLLSLYKQSFHFPHAESPFSEYYINVFFGGEGELAELRE